MDAALVAAARALSRGDPLVALKHVALRADAQALALRATALAQLGEYKAAKLCFGRASRGFGPQHPAARARCVIGLADVALASRELTFSHAALSKAVEVLTRSGDLANAHYGQLLCARHALARGELEATRAHLEAVHAKNGARTCSPLLRALLFLTQAELCVRLVQPAQASAALSDALHAAREAGIPALHAEVSAARQALRKPVARLVSGGVSRLVTLDTVALLAQSEKFVVDGCRRVVRRGARVVYLSARPVLFSLLRQVAEASPGDVSREDLIRAGFGMQRLNESLRVRLRMSMARLRKLLSGMAEVVATPRGFVLAQGAQPVYLLLPPAEDESSSLLALIADGEAWSTSALSLALGSSQRSVQRALRALVEDGKVRTLGRGKSRRWLAVPLTQLATPLLLPVASLRGSS